MPERAVIAPESRKLGAQPRGTRVLSAGERTFRLRRAVLGRILVGVGKRAQVTTSQACPKILAGSGSWKESLGRQ